MTDLVVIPIVIGVLIGIPVLIFLLKVLCGFRVIRHKHVAIVERFGKFHKIAQPGLHYLIPGVDSIRPLRWRETYLSIGYGGKVNTYAHQTEITQIGLNECLYDFRGYKFFSRDNVEVTVRPVMTYKVVDPMKVVYEIYDLSQAMERLVQTTLRGLVGSMGLDDALASRTELTRSLMSRITRECLGWGVEVLSVHLLEIHPNESIQHAMHSQISSERLRRAGVVEAQGYRESVKLETEGQSFSAVVLAKAKARVMELEALGDAQSRVTLAKAEAEALNIMRGALEGCNVDAAQYQIGDKYLSGLAAVLKRGNVTVTMPIQTDLVGCTRLLSQE